ncbi:calcium/proton exchanger [Verruconis gallopava]|uniref:Vacuolar calcium ion transporter n=1 Tax=Verruconis gallopava TaxID=253628 RepID=A0A0D2AHP8_9PEZI|nr:calcium/proton exchanger [Verruconis gallopava]KIW06075.1 calcium/proton exchanger [Verruconis gallopava]
MTTRVKPSSRRRSNPPLPVMDPYATEPKHLDHEMGPRSASIPVNQGKKITPGVRAEGESGRKGFHPLKFLTICFRSSCTLSKLVNVLWPFVPAAFALRYARPHEELWIFILSYIAMVPAANLLGFAGQELGRKLPHVFATLLETTLGSVVEIILFMVLISRGDKSVPIIKAAILGSILANLLLCLGACFFAGGLRRDEQEFHEAVSEVGSNLMLVAGMGLIVPAVFSSALNITSSQSDDILNISRATAVILLFGYLVFVFFQMRSHHGLYEEALHADEHKDADRHRDLYKQKLTFTECVVAIAIAITCVAFMAIFLVEKIEYIVEKRGIKDAFLGLILVPLVEKAAEHLTAVDEAWDDQMNFALSHVLGASIQTALFNAPLVVIVSWGLGHRMDFNFEIFDAGVLILAILVIGNFLRDGKSNYLEGVLCVLVYMIIAISAFFYPNPTTGHETSSGSTAESTSAEEVAHAIIKMARQAKMI